MDYEPILFPFRVHRLGSDAWLAVSESGDHAFLDYQELDLLVHAPAKLPVDRMAELKSKFFLGARDAFGVERLLSSRVAARNETVLGGPSLHIIVPTLQCGHSCRYCQVSRSLENSGFAMPVEQLTAACDAVFESPSQVLTVEFQGGDPLIRFDLVRRAIDRIAERNLVEKRDLRFVVASTLHQLDMEMCLFFRKHGVLLSTSLDGPARLHDKNRPLPTRDAHRRTLAGIELARTVVGPDCVSAVMTTTRESLQEPEAIVDEYVDRSFVDIFVRPLSLYGFARRNQHSVGYSLGEFACFYERALDRVLYWNRRGVPLREVSAAILFNKILSPFDAGYVDLQTPAGAGIAVLVYNYDGYVYPSDEARMLAETGDVSLRLGRIGDSIESLLSGVVARNLVRTSLVRYVPGCRDCAFSSYCGPDPVGAQARFGTMEAPVHMTDHCQLHTWMFEHLFGRLRNGDPWLLDLAHRWARNERGAGD